MTDQQPAAGLRELISATLARFGDVDQHAMADAVLETILGPIPDGTDTATWTAVRAIQLMNEAGRQRDEAQAELAALRAVSRGYCPACGRGDAAPTVDDWEQQKQRADQAEAALARVEALAARIAAGHPVQDNPDNLAAAVRDAARDGGPLEKAGE